MNATLSDMAALYDNIEWLEENPPLRNPVAVIAYEGWNDAADAASGVLNHLLEHHDARPLARLHVEEYVNFQEMRPCLELENEDRKIVWPATRFMGVELPEHEHDLVAVVGDEPHYYWRKYCGQVEAALRRLGVGEAVTLGAFLGQIPHTMPVQIFGLSTDPDFPVKMNVHPSDYEGPIGITGVLHGCLEENGMEAHSLWAGVPHYLAANPSPTAIRALLHKLGEVIGWHLKPGDLEEQVERYEESIRAAVEDSTDFNEYVRQLEEESDHLTITPRDSHRMVEDIERFLQDPSSA